MSKNKLKKDSKEWLKILIFCMCLTGLWGFLHEQLFVSVFVSSVIQKDPTHILKNANVIERSAWGAARTMWYGIFIFIPVTMVARLGKKK